MKEMDFSNFLAESLFSFRIALSGTSFSSKNLISNSNFLCSSVLLSRLSLS
jgi:hypothetical protein